MMEKLLFEIGTEEIPAKFMPGILTQLKDLAERKLTELRIPFDEVKVFGTPRRMAFTASSIPEVQDDITIEAKGPSVKIAFVDNEPSKAAIGFARGNGVDVKDLVIRDDYVYAVKRLTGQHVEGLLPEMLLDIIISLNFPKTMRWADHDFRFVRPIRWLVALLGDRVIPVEMTGVKSGKFSRGHRFLAGSLKEAEGAKGFLSMAARKAKNSVASAVISVKGAVEIPNADDYEKILREHFVLVDQDERREIIRRQVTDLAEAEGGHAEIDEDLLEEVNYLVEWPTALCGKFEEKFLGLPKECIITPMREHQRYFPVLNSDGTLMNKFITVRNGGLEDIDIVTHGNERVLRARLSDAEFFFNADRKLKLEDRLEKLKTISFQEGFGSMYDKTQRLVKLSDMIYFAMNAKADKEKLARTALLSKTDLVTGMVVEFTELQGVMGREYAKLDGESEEVAKGIYEHYLPRFAGDELPETEIGRIVGIADKLDNIVAIFSRGLAPTGSQDPYALRRQALGIINIVIDAGYHVALLKLLGGMIYLLNIGPDKAGELILQVLDFIRQRLRNMVIDQGIRYDVVDAVMKGKRNDDLNDVYLRAMILNDFVKTPEAEHLIQAAVRVANICENAAADIPVNPALFEYHEEKNLHDAVTSLNSEIISATVQFNYEQVLKLACGLVAPINEFFDKVMVMDENEKIRNNRLALLEAVKDITHVVGDLNSIVM